MTAHDIIEGHLIITQEKTKRTHNIVTATLLTNMHGKRLTAAVLRNHFDEARTKAAEALPKLA